MMTGYTARYRQMIPSTSDLGGWVLRGGVAVFFVMAGLEKFDPPPNEWIDIFTQIGLGQWFRYLTGWVEIIGAILYFPAWTCPIGAAFLACTMACAVIVHISVLHNFGAWIEPALLLFAIIAIAARRPEQPLKRHYYR